VSNDARQRKPVLDRVPLGGACGIMSDSDRQPEFISQVLQPHLPGPTTVAVGASAVGFDGQPRHTRIPMPPNLQPPRTNRRRRRPSRRNCRSRCGSFFPPNRLRFDRNEYFCARSRRATVTCPTCTPRRAKAAARLRVVLCVQRRPPIGSPAVASRNNPFNHSRTRGVFFRRVFVRRRDVAPGPKTLLVRVRSRAIRGGLSCGSGR